MGLRTIGLAGFAFVFFACASVKKGGSGDNAFANYNENLSENRITFPDIPTASVTEETGNGAASGNLSVDEDLDYALSRFSEQNLEERYYSGFTILVYSGIDRELAFKTRNDIYKVNEEIKPEMQYQQPRYLVKVGKYVNRIEAQATYFTLKEHFPTARIIQDRFERENWKKKEELNDLEREN
ncbi:hypothetical protein [Pararhodonellum marinum]|uniref:hypothetical protein n=1 Tax=Pararhodonellum marinum TaxID=2755358 RepID=UPI00188EDD3F|nr:hypothetical protein [Pararhodonellum marinum]